MNLLTDFGDLGIFFISCSRLARYSSRIFEGLFDRLCVPGPDVSVNCKNSLFSMVSSRSVMVVLVKLPFSGSPSMIVVFFSDASLLKVSSERLEPSFSYQKWEHKTFFYTLAGYIDFFFSFKYIVQ